MTPEEFEDLWETKGLKYRMGDWYDMLTGCGLNAMSLTFNNFLSNARLLLYEFLVEGITRKPPEERSGLAVLWWQRLNQDVRPKDE